MLLLTKEIDNISKINILEIQKAIKRFLYFLSLPTKNKRTIRDKKLKISKNILRISPNAFSFYPASSIIFFNLAPFIIALTKLQNNIFFQSKYWIRAC